jgi:hypothetical protein
MRKIEWARTGSNSHRVYISEGTERQFRLSEEYRRGLQNTSAADRAWLHGLATQAATAYVPPPGPCLPGNLLSLFGL